MSRQYAEMYYRPDERGWVLVTPFQDSEFIETSTDYLKALNEVSKMGWELVHSVSMNGFAKFILYRELPEKAFEETFITMLSKDFKEMEKKLDDVIRAYEIAKDTIKERDIIIKSLLLEGRDSISVTGEFEELITKATLESFDLTCTVKEQVKKHLLSVTAYIEDKDIEVIEDE